ncbi:acyltransferase family protein [Spirillospora sp. NPDC048819]|uniref:acyltransferase family protein n=1 Tax=Spirillospora sp. NPDC048819 TaxID=3155268 RepID=UPI00340EB455
MSPAVMTYTGEVPTSPTAAPTVEAPSSARAPSTPEAAQASAPQAAPAPRKPRDPFFDNVKYLAILLVVLGHSLGYVTDVPMAKGLYVFVYMFHMPLFILITGYLSRNWSFSSGKARKLITHVGVPYVVFEFTYAIYGWLAGGKQLEISLLKPYYLMWFLLALFLWRLSTPVWQQIRWPVAGALLIALLSYMSDLGSTFHIHRVLGLLPFYVIGLKLKPEHFEILKKPVARPIGALVLAVALGCGYLARDRMDLYWLYFNHPNSRFGVGNFDGTLMRLAMFACGLVMVAAFLSLTPRRNHWFTKLGAATLYCYLLHGFVILAVKYTGLWGTEWLHTVPGVLVVCAAAMVVGTFLLTKPVIRCTRWALEPKMTWAFTPLRRPGAAGGQKRPRSG